MELVKGLCFLCNDKKLILNRSSERIQKIFQNLYTETVLNIQELQSITPSLKFCPVCHHKLILLEEILKHIQSNQNENDENCTLCKKGEFIFKITKWSYFKVISDDFPVLSDKNKYNVCSQCCFYLDSRYNLKKRLFLKYPQLRIVPKLKLKFGSEIISHSTPFKTQKDRSLRHRICSTEVVYISDTEESPKDVKSLDLSSIKSFKALRHNKSLRRSKMVSEDPKLLNQILYVKVTKNNLSFDKQILPSTDDQVEKDLERLAQIVSKKSSLKRKNSDDLSDRSSCEKVEVSDSNENKEALEGLTYSKNDTDRSHVKKSAYFKIKLKKPTSKSKKIVTEHHDDKKHIAMATDFRKSLVINLERGAIPLGTIDPKSEKHIENGKDVSIEVIESEERSQTITDSLRMEVDTPDESKIGNPTEEQISPMITEDQENREKVLESKEKSSISDSEEGDRESTEENENSKNTVPNSPSNISEQESHEPANHNVEKVNLDGEESSEDPEVREEPSVENITTKMKSTCHNNEEKRYQASDDESPTSGAPENEEESCNRKSDQDQEDTDHKPKADSVPEKIMGDEELSSKKEGRDEKEIETGEKSGNEEAGEEETTNKDRSDVIKNDDEKDNDDKNENSDKEIEINDEDRKNIDLILTGLETDPSKSSQEDSEEKELSENNIKDTDEESEISAGCKRKRADSPDLSNCPEKKKKKVTFSEDVLDAGE